MLMLKRGRADAGDARARWPADADDAQNEARLMLLMLGPDNRLMLMQTRSG